MRVWTVPIAASVAACSPRPTSTTSTLPATSSSAAALTRAHLDPARDEVFQQEPGRALLGVFLPTVLPESDTRPVYRVLAYDAERDQATEVLPRAEWAAWAGTRLLAVEEGALVLHEGQARRTLLTHAAPDFAIDPSSRWIAAVVRKPALALDTDLVLLPVEGGPVRTLAAFEGSSESRPIFTPDDRAVIFVSGKTGLASLYRVELAGGAITPLTNQGLEGGSGKLPEGFLPPPPERGAMRFDGPDTLVYEAAGRPIRVDVRGER